MHYMVLSRYKHPEINRLLLEPIATDVERILSYNKLINYDKFFDNMRKGLCSGMLNAYLLTKHVFHGSEVPTPTPVDDIEFIPSYLLLSPFSFYRLVPSYPDASASNTPEYHVCRRCGSIVHFTEFINVNDAEWCRSDLGMALRHGDLIYVFAEECKHLNMLFQPI